MFLQLIFFIFLLYLVYKKLPQKMSVSENEKVRRRLRQSKAWKTLRHQINVSQHSVDPITKKKLIARSCTLHHLDQRFENYTKIDNMDNFVLLNRRTHEMLHFIYTYYIKDKTVIDRLVYYLEKMIEKSSS